MTPPNPASVHFFPRPSPATCYIIHPLNHGCARQRRGRIRATWTFAMFTYQEEKTRDVCQRHP
jgi:hypothetical protein